VIDFLFGGPNAGIRRQRIYHFSNSWRGWLIYAALLFLAMTFGERTNLGARITHGSFWQALLVVAVLMAFIEIAHRVVVRVVSEQRYITVDYSAWAANALAQGFVIGVFF
jgi:hypothetical protein